jgi:hypothetical protein
VPHLLAAHRITFPSTPPRREVNPTSSDRQPNLEVTPQVPPYETELSGANVRLGSGFVDVRAARSGDTYTTAVRLGLAVRLRLGATVPLGAHIGEVLLDGSPVAY